MKLLKFRLIMCMVFTVSVSSGCTESSGYNIGGVIAQIPAPDNFRPLKDKAPKFREMMVKTFRSAALVELYLTDQDLSSVAKGSSGYRNSSLVVKVPLATFGENLSEEDFRNLANQKVVNAGKDFGEGMRVEEKRFKGLNSDVDNSKPFFTDEKWLGIFLSDKNEIGIASIVSLHRGSDVKKSLGIVITSRLKSRLVIFQCDSFVDSDADIKPWENICSTWVSHVLAKN
jgi:hypothetical protein